MAAIIENKNGTITIETEVIKHVAGMAAMDCYGIVGMAAKSMKDDMFRLLKLETLTKGVKLFVDDADGSLSIKLHIIVEYGTNIHAIADSLVSNVKYTVEEISGLDVSNIEIFVEGVRVEN